MLVVIATPIGNLEDISARALKALGNADAILCEDTRRSLILLQHYGIKKKLISYHKFKEQALLEEILTRLQAGETLALISDAGTPCINDPGQRLIDACFKRGVPVTAIPGACSLIQALVLSGFPTDRFQFIGFVAKETLKSALLYPGATVAFESPERLIDTLMLLPPKREVAVLREMTKTFEECRRGTALEVLTHFEKTAPRGEIVLVIGPGEEHEDLDVEEAVKMLQELHGMSLKEAIRAAAHLTKQRKQDVYKKFHNP